MSLKDLVVGRESLLPSPTPQQPPPPNTAPDLGDAEATQERAALADDDGHDDVTTLDSESYEPKVIVKPQADGTSELGADDILEVEELTSALAETHLEEDDDASLDIFATLTPKKRNPVAALLDRARGVANAKAAEQAAIRARAAAEAAQRAEAEAAQRAAIAAEDARRRELLALTMPPRDHYPSSMTPMALDVSPQQTSIPPAPRVPSFAPELTRTVGMQQRPIPAALYRTLPMRPRQDSFPNTASYLNRLPLKRTSFEAYIAAGALAAVALLGGIALIASLAFSSSSRSSASSSDDGAPARVARPMVIEAANEGMIQKPLSGSEKVGGTSSSSSSSDTASHAAASIHSVSAPAASSDDAEPKRSVAAAAPAPAPAQKRSGVIRVSPLLRGVLVDGAPHAVHGGAVVVTCGRHTVKAPGGSAHAVDVPCGGSTSI